MPQTVNGVGHAYEPQWAQASVEPVPERQTELQSEDWGSHFGMEETEPPPAAPSGGGGGEQEIELSTSDISEGGAIAVERSAAREEMPQDEQLDQAFSEPPPAVESAYETGAVEMGAEAMEPPPAVESTYETGVVEMGAEAMEPPPAVESTYETGAVEMGAEAMEPPPAVEST